MQIPMHMETSVLLVVLLFFLISLLVNLLQHRYGRARTDRLLNEQESVRDFLARLDHSLGKVESACTFEIEGASSPKQTGKAIHIARNQIKSTISDAGKKRGRDGRDTSRRCERGDWGSRSCQSGEISRRQPA
ncbi:MAG: hypothetical protein JRH07_15780 [Deltaproteobacteria bacterium]|nr:hypothetical protein [Deltaproteobacteria bacterium]